MAADETAAATTVVLSASKPPPPVDTSLSNISSPLTEVEDKDGDPDDMSMDGPLNRSSMTSGNGHADDAQPRPISDNDEDSALSDMNDSEAETERLYDTPIKTKNIKDGRVSDSSPERLSPSRRLAAQKRERNFQASPSKLKQQLRADGTDSTDKHTNDDEEGDELSDLDAEDEENEADGEEEAAIEKEASGGRRKTNASEGKEIARTGTADKKETSDKDDAPAHATVARGQRANADTRKRKRSPTTDPSEPEQPLRKRAGPGGGGPRETVAETSKGSEDTLAKAHPDNASKGEKSIDIAAGDKAASADEQDATEGANSDTIRARRSKRSDSKKSKDTKDGSGEDDEGYEVGHEEVPEAHEKVQEEAHEEADDEAQEEQEPAAAEDDNAAVATDGHAAEVNEEAEAAHRNEEELERKKAAFEQLQAIERRFASFRDKLYQERLDQLNQEEAMLQGDNPTHPEYLAMLQCVASRRDEKIRLSALEYQYNMKTLKAWAVGRRSQIHGQYFQNVRESRELVLEELGRQWYQIQQQRRRHANTIPDYGLRFPALPVQRIKDAIAYNREVSILSGVAKYEGFPAAPQIRGASIGQVDDDIGAIASARSQGADSPYHEAVGNEPSYVGQPLPDGTWPSSQQQPTQPQQQQQIQQVQVNHTAINNAHHHLHNGEPPKREAAAVTS